MAQNNQLRTNVGDQVIARVEELGKAGFTFPADYNVVNAIKSSMLVLQELKDKLDARSKQIQTEILGLYKTSGFK